MQHSSSDQVLSLPADQWVARSAYYRQLIGRAPSTKRNQFSTALSRPPRDVHHSHGTEISLYPVVHSANLGKPGLAECNGRQHQHRKALQDTSQSKQRSHDSLQSRSSPAEAAFTSVL